MIAYIDGELAYLKDGHAVVDVGGIGYSINITQPAIIELEEMIDKTPHSRVRLYTHHHVREDAILLYGFIHKNEMEMFKILIRVSGVGPQTALNILSQILPEDFAMAISREDVGVLSSISGIGPKSAKRLILELKDRIKKEMEGLKTTSPLKQTVNSNGAAYDAICGLVSLGFTKKEAETAVNAASNAIALSGSEKSPTTELLITNALAYIREG